MLAAFSITPLGAGDSVSDSVAETNAMFTNVEGEWDEVMDVLKQCVERVLEDAPRVSVTMKLDVRPGTTDALHDKVRAVEDHLA
jgi:uncharacterized protein YqgV (UPF0045/DUF77 family)